MEVERSSDHDSVISSPPIIGMDPRHSDQGVNLDRSSPDPGKRKSPQGLSSLESTRHGKNSLNSSPVKHPQDPKERSHINSTSMQMSSNQCSGSETFDMPAASSRKRFEVQASASESETEKRSRISGIDYTIVHKESGHYKKIVPSELRSVIRLEILRNLENIIKSPLNAQARKFTLVSI